MTGKRIVAILAIFALCLSPSYAQGLCANNTGTDLTYVPNPTYCSAYVTCKGTQMVTSGFCPAGTGIVAGACSSKITCPPGGVMNICNGKTDATSVPDPTTCFGYYYCLANAGFPGTCPADYYFDGVSGECVYGPNYVCSGTGSSLGEAACSQVPPGSFAPSATNCYDYYYCTPGGTPTSGTCPSDLYFDSLTGQCGYPQDVKCNIPGGGTTSSTTAAPSTGTVDPGVICEAPDASGFAPDPASCNGYYYCPSGAASTTVQLGFCATGKYFNAGQCLATPATGCASEPCYGKAAGYFAGNPYNCMEYYSCVGDNTASPAASCPAGYVFDQTNQICNTAAAAKCTPVPGGSSSTAGPGSSSSSTDSSSSSTDSSSSSSSSSSTDSSSSSSSTDSSSSSSGDSGDGISPPYAG